MTLQLTVESHRRLQKPAQLQGRLKQCIWNEKLYHTASNKLNAYYASVISILLCEKFAITASIIYVLSCCVLTVSNSWTVSSWGAKDSKKVLNVFVWASGTCAEQKIFQGSFVRPIKAGCRSENQVRSICSSVLWNFLHSMENYR